MKKLIVTRCHRQKEHDMISLTHPILENYANKCGADFLVLDELKYWDLPTDDIFPKAMYAVFRCKELLNDYDRILNIDSDVLITTNCPNLFEIVPYDYIGGVCEDVGSRKHNRRHLIQLVQERFGGIGWTSDFINGGLWVVSKPHANIFSAINGELWNLFGLEMTHINYTLQRLGHTLCKLPFVFNHMSMFSEPWNNNADRLKSHIIHYAGGAKFPGNDKDRVELMKQDAKQLGLTDA